MENGAQEQTLDQAELLAQMFPKDSNEYQLLLRYAQKKKTTQSHSPQSNSVEEAKDASTATPQDSRKPRKLKKPSFLKLISCIRPVKEDDGPVPRHPRQRATADSSGPGQEEVERIVKKLTKITDSVHFLPTEIETDGDDVVDRIVELLREQGDKLNEEIEKNHVLRKELQGALSYAFFTKVAQTFMQRITPDELPNAESRKETEIALTCELTSRLNAMDSHPMNRVLGFGAKYLNDYFSPWVIQQGGYDKVFCRDGDSEEEEVQ